MKWAIRVLKDERTRLQAYLGYSKAVDDWANTKLADIEDALLLLNLGKDNGKAY